VSAHSGYTGSIALNAITAPDSYTAASTIEGITIDHIVLDVANQSIFWQLQIETRGGHGNWEASEKLMLPGSKQITRKGICGIRVRARVPAAQIPAGFNQAVVTVEAVT
jgi:hypothetical protein